jgi:hypothetical protein
MNKEKKYIIINKEGREVAVDEFWYKKLIIRKGYSEPEKKDKKDKK